MSEYRSRVSRPPIPLWCPLPKVETEVPPGATRDDGSGLAGLVIGWAELEWLKDD